MRPYLIILYFIACVTVGAASDALNSIQIHTWGHLFDVLEIGLILSGWAMFKLTSRQVFAFIGAYVCFRVVGFDYLFNWFYGNKWTYNGGRNWWDMFLNMFPPTLHLFPRAIFLITGISLTFKYLKNYNSV